MIILFNLIDNVLEKNDLK